MNERIRDSKHNFSGWIIKQEKRELQINGKDEM